MPSIRGRFEYDDDDLTPGKKKEGGLHQNLYDADGNLKASARFIPDDPDEEVESSSPNTAEPEYDFINDDSSETTDEDEDALGEIIAYLIILGVVTVAPHVITLWREVAWPAIKNRWRTLTKRHRPSVDITPLEPNVIEGEAIDPSLDLAETSHDYQVNMSSAEAQERYLLALAAQAIADQQWGMINRAHIEDPEGLKELQHFVAELPPQQRVRLIEHLRTSTTVLNEKIWALGNTRAVDMRAVPNPVDGQQQG